MAKDLAISLEDRPGSLATMGEALGEAGINIEGFCGVTAEGKGLIHILVEEPEKARQTLEAAGIEVTGEQDVVVVELEDRPGVLGEVARKLASGDVNIQLSYLATSTRLVLGVDDLEKAREILAPS
ncbi:MAG: amino acid-binding protein [Anaerolineales bacterium]|nr:amino acid-binding protein [Anaerolineales bacterium]